MKLILCRLFSFLSLICVFCGTNAQEIPSNISAPPYNLVELTEAIKAGQVNSKTTLELNSTLRDEHQFSLLSLISDFEKLGQLANDEVRKESIRQAISRIREVRDVAMGKLLVLHPNSSKRTIISKLYAENIDRGMRSYGLVFPNDYWPYDLPGIRPANQNEWNKAELDRITKGNWSGAYMLGEEILLPGVRALNITNKLDYGFESFRGLYSVGLNVYPWMAGYSDSSSWQNVSQWAADVSLTTGQWAYVFDSVDPSGSNKFDQGSDTFVKAFESHQVVFVRFHWVHKYGYVRGLTLKGKIDEVLNDIISTETWTGNPKMLKVTLGSLDAQGFEIEVKSSVEPPGVIRYVVGIDKGNGLLFSYTTFIPSEKLTENELKVLHASLKIIENTFTNLMTRIP